MRFGRCLAAGGVVALVMLAVTGASPARAAAPTASITAPGSGDVVSGTASVQGSANQDNGAVTGITLSINSDDGWGAPATTQTYSGSDTSVFTRSGTTVTFKWSVAAPAHNGKYTITLQGTTHEDGLFGGDHPFGPITRPFSFQSPPNKPTGVTAGWADEAAKQAKVTWNPNPEPDIAFYQVLRSYANGSAKKVGSPVAPSSKPSLTDDLSGQPTGQYKYQVQAVRKARSGTGCSASPAPSECSAGVAGLPSSYSAPVTIGGAGATTTTSTTTTTIKKSGGGGTTGGGGTGGSTGGSTTGGSTTGGSTTGGSTTGGTTSGGTTSGSNGVKNSGGFAPGGTVNLSDFAALLNGTGKTTTNGANRPIDEGTYDPTLKYDSNGNVIGTKSNDGDQALITIGGHSVPKPSDDWVRFIGAGSLVTALLVHVLWFKQQVDRLPLEPIVD